MASKIRVLSDSTINKIAAGEVVENPASVVKELVENALDAGSTEICVEIKGGGRQLIRVSDNGSGMTADDAVLCLERHATSKIKAIEDIYALDTMGFRGEAIPSIAAISKFSLLTSLHLEEKNQKGTLVVVEGGQILSSTPAIRSPGTTIEVKSLFFNIPVRKKFQKSPTYDTQEILKIMSLLALGYPTIQFELISDQKSLLKTTVSQGELSFQDSLKQRIESVLGAEFANALFPISFHKEPYNVTGFIGLPTYTKHNRTGQHLFINRRAVQSPLISFAVKEGYGTALDVNRHPIFVLHLSMPGSLVDINVHPQKKEVRLRQEMILKESLIEAIQIVLKNQSFNEEKMESRPFEPIYEQFLSSPSFEVAEVPFTKEEEPPAYWQAPSFKPPFRTEETWQPIKQDPKTIPSPSIPHSFTPIDSSPLSSEPILPNEQPSSFFDLKTSTKVPLKALTTIQGFILIDSHSVDRQSSYYRGHEGLYIIDQKAAHARIHYERLLNNLRLNKNASFIEPLLIPITLDFSTLESLILKEHLELLNQMGFSIQEFGDQTFIIDAIPKSMEKEDLKTCLVAIAQDMQELQDHRRVQREKEKQIALAASRAAVSTKKQLKIDEAQSLLNQLAHCDNPFQCPMGQQILTHFSLEDLQSQFKFN